MSKKQDTRSKIQIKDKKQISNKNFGLWFFKFAICLFLVSCTLSLASSALPIITNEELTSISDTTAVITWTTTNEAANTQVYYGIGSASTQYISAESTANHYALITGLHPGTIYSYYVKSGSTEGLTKTFRTLTPPNGQYLFTFATITDTHYAVGKSDTTGARGRPYSKTVDILKAVTAEINAFNPAFTIIKGDIVESISDGVTPRYGDYVNNLAISSEGKTIKQIFDTFTKASDASAKYYPIPGNHDKNPFAYTGGGLSSWYTDSLNALYPLTVTPTQDSCFNYSIDDYHGYRFIMLDSVKLNMSAEVNAAYLSAQLSDARSKNLKCFIFLHHPATDVRSEGIPDDILKEITGGLTVDYSKIQIINTAEVQTLISTYKSNVAGVFSGHIHDNHYSTVEGVPYVRTSSGLQFPVGYNIYKVYSNGFMQTFYKIRNWTETGREVVTPEAGYSDIYWEQFALGTSTARNFSHTIDLSAPSVSYSNPPSTQTSVPINENIIIKFTKAMSTEATQNAITISPAVTNTAYAWTAPDTLSIAHDNFAPSTSYTLTISTQAKDSTNTPLATTEVLTFTTSAATDTVPPTGTFDHFTFNITSDNQPTFTGIATDELSEIISIECRIDSGAWLPASPLDGKFNTKEEQFNLKAPSTLLRSTQSHTIEVRCKDAAQNMASSSFGSYSFYVIGDKPEIALTRGGSAILSGDPIGASPSFEVLVVSNNGLTLNPLYAIVDNGSPTALTKVTYSGHPEYITAIYNPTLEDGTHNIKITTADDLSNASTREVVGLTVQANSELTLLGTPLNNPNPYSGTGTVSIAYTLSKNSNITLTIHDLMGTQLVRKTYTSTQTGGSAGYNEVTWNGKTDSGQDLGNGMYIYVIAGNGSIIGKGTLVVAR